MKLIKFVSDLIREDDRTVPMKKMKGWAAKGEVMSNVGKRVVKMKSWVNVYYKNSLRVETVWVSPLEVMGRTV